MYPILEKRALAEQIWLMKILAPRVARSARPGQFVIVRADERGERIPLTISDYDAAEGSVTLVIQAIGASTRKICALGEGDALADFAGPLGRPSEFVSTPPEELRRKRFLFVAGGVGAAPVYPQVKWLHERGVAADVIVGAKTRGMLIYTEPMRAVAGQLHIATDDGSEGDKGLVTQVLERLVGEQGRRYDECIAIGPMDEVRRSGHEEIRTENHRVAQHPHGGRHGHVRRLPRDGGRTDALHVRRRPGVRRTRGGFRRGHAPSGHVPERGAARRGDRGRTRGGTPM